MSVEIPRYSLPIADVRRPGLTTYDAQDPETAYPAIRPLRPPAGAPNVLLILLDDVGFGASSAFGGPVAMPVAERLAAGGLKYTRFHTTALCSPSRAALLSGRNHHAVGMGAITEIATAAPGYSSMRPNTITPLAEILRLNGYATGQFGKCHEVPAWETSPVGPFDRWPTGSGFEHFFGFIAGETNQWYPALHEGVTPVDAWGTPEEGYHLMPDLADKTIAWVRQQKALTPDQPFFAYFAPGATHAPHHVPAEWADKYKGAFDEGWDALREQTFARQKQLGVIPADCDLTARHEEIPAWEDMSDALKPVLARQMEVYAGFLEYADHHTGRVLDALEQLGVLEDTVVYYIIGDNGASAEGTMRGTLNEMALPEAPGLESDEYLVENLDKIGGPEGYNHYAIGWAHAMCTPVSVDQADRLALGRDAQRHDRALAGRHQRQGGAAQPVLPRHRLRADRARARGTARAHDGQRHHAGADARGEHGLQLRGPRRSRAPRHPVLRDRLQPRHLSPRLVGGHPPSPPLGADRQRRRPRRRRLGALRRHAPTGPRRTTSPTSIRRSSPSCSGCF